MVHVPRKAKVVYEKMLNITGHRRNVNQNPTETPVHTYGDGHYQKIKNDKFWQGNGEMGPLCVATETAKGGAALETSMEFPQKVKHGIPIRSSNPTSGHVPQSANSRTCTSFCTLRFMTALFVTAKSGNHPRVHCWVNG